MIEEKNKDKFSKLLPLAILVLFISTFVRNCYIIFSVDINETILEGLTKLSREILLALYIFTTRVLIPGLVYLFVAWITYRMLEKRGFKRIMDGNKFLSILLFFISVALLFAGGIDLFAFINHTLFTYTAAFLDMIALAIALVLMYVFIIKPVLKTTKAKKAYITCVSRVFFIYEALSTLLPCVTVVLIYVYKQDPQFAELFENYIYTSQDLIPCIIGIAIYVAIIISYFVATFIVSRYNDDMQTTQEETISYNTDLSSEANNPKEYDPFEAIDEWGNDITENNKDNIDNNSSDIWDN